MHNGKPHIVIVSHLFPSVLTPFWGTFVLNQALALVTAGYMVSVINPVPRMAWLVSKLKAGMNPMQPPEVAHNELFTVYHPRFWAIGKYLNYIRRYSYNKAILDSLTKLPHKADLIIARFGLESGDAALKSGISYYIYEDSSLITEMNQEQFNAFAKPYQQAKKVLTVSKFLQNSLAEKNINAIVLPNIVPNIPKLSHKPLEPFVVLMIANVDKKLKRVNWFLKLTTQFPNMEFRLVGFGKESSCRKLENVQQISPNFKFLGPLSPQMVMSQFSKAHVLLSLSTLETFGMTILEAMFFGLPVIATQSGGPDSFVTSPHYLVPKHDFSAVCAALQHCKENYAFFDAASIQKQAIEQFGLDSWMIKFNDIFCADDCI